MIDELLEKAGLKFEELNASERETLNVWMEVLQKGQVSVEKIKEYIVAMREGVEKEMVDEPPFIRILIFKVDNPRLIQLQARLKNYILLDAFLSTPERAKQRMEATISSIVGKKVV